MSTFSRFSLVAAGATSALLIMGAGCASPQDAKHMPEQGMEKPTEQKPMGGMKMEPQKAPDLTDAQKTQLAAGAAVHAPTELMFDVVGGMFYFQPNEIHVKKGDKVKIVFKHDGAGGMHNFMLDEFNVKTDPIKSGETKEFEFVADKAGTFEYYCSVAQHRQMGQKGKLIVTE